jgi:hypothetical protein
MRSEWGVGGCAVKEDVRRAESRFPAGMAERKASAIAKENTELSPPAQKNAPPVEMTRFVAPQKARLWLR